MNLVPTAAARTNRPLRHESSPTSVTKRQARALQWDARGEVVKVNSAGKFVPGKDGYPASGEPVSASQKVIPYRPESAFDHHNVFSDD
ncbi:hypothetical protein N7508_006682 [Penicillium antarcticum]|uniref:uncharacterized protein n=1 Tax=Penicillium antarcticum TaxID=416450 RepID=UPI0023A257E8|nr:uncharacterized protein N7508_006682 [Penicillium antarcticum]KAJ5301819.1 hypothetical protein N7508_006682 [Penicillium antarcticum]